MICYTCHFGVDLVQALDWHAFFDVAPPSRRTEERTHVSPTRSGTFAYSSQVAFDHHASIYSTDLTPGYCFVMATNTYLLPSRIPMGRTAASSSLPPELKMTLNESRSQPGQFDAARIAQMLSPTTMAPSSYLAYFLLGESTRRRLADRSGISDAFRPGLYSARCLREFGLIVGFPRTAL